MKTTMYVVAALVAAFLAFGFMSGNTPEGKEIAKQRAVIRLCWDDQGKKSLGPAEAQFIANVCEKKEQEFQAKWGRRP
jgi:hypothetical protein